MVVGAGSRRSGSSPVPAAACQSTSSTRGATRRASAARCRLARPGAGRARLGARARDGGLDAADVDPEDGDAEDGDAEDGDTGDGDTEDVDTAERTLRRRSLAGTRCSGDAAAAGGGRACSGLRSGGPTQAARLPPEVDVQARHEGCGAAHAIKTDPDFLLSQSGIYGSERADTRGPDGISLLRVTPRRRAAPRLGVK
ncbi:hypothetical protein Acsp04_11000 [Actinomadura sp. NBRC 104425]|nr:hypothetical protein Acsp04_11000 [Actinomadura sp. NBRC 104425]